MAIETRKEKMDHMFALMEEVRVLVGRLEPRDTGHIHTTINLLNDRVEELRNGLSKNGEMQESLFNTKRDNPWKEGTD
jgi:anion-transporting  ArsA/GET3 family ATPase